MYSQSTPMNTVHNFFNQQRSLNYQNYLQRKQEELSAEKQYHAAVKIQAAFRGWLIRSNMKLITAATIKIQALWRRALARIHWRDLYQNHLDKKRQDLENKMATKIQAAWRGYQSRKNNLDFKVYKELQAKNAKLLESIDKINELEAAISETSHRSHLSNESNNEEMSEGSEGSLIHEQEASETSIQDSIKTIDDILNGSLEELSMMSSNRIAELFTYAIGSQFQQSGYGDGDGSSRGSRPARKGDGVNPGRSPSSCRGVGQNLSKELLDMRDSITDMFPDIPDNPDLVKADPQKIEVLEKAIRLLRKQIKEMELKKAYKHHYLLRTASVPGVYSDIYTNEFTEIEKKMKALKFWKPPSKNRFITPLPEYGSTSYSKMKGGKFNLFDRSNRKDPKPVRESYSKVTDTGCPGKLNQNSVSCGDLEFNCDSPFRSIYFRKPTKYSSTSGIPQCPDQFYEPLPQQSASSLASPKTTTNCN